jgi:hypothetical protein
MQYTRMPYRVLLEIDFVLHVTNTRVALEENGRLHCMARTEDGSAMNA